MKKRILFVDDEPRVLQGLRRMLRSLRDQWEMSFAESGQQALDMMNQQEYDVIVSDMKMPGMNGAQLLSEVKEKYPQIVRIVLSGYSENEYIMNSIRPAHQYLSKPCDAETLRTTVNRACSLQNMLKDESLKKVVSKMESLPSIPSIYRQLMNELRSPDASIKKVGQIISQDVGMTAKILQLVNSAFFGLKREVSSPELAASLIGINNIKALVMTVEIFSQYNDIGIPGFSIDALWRHSLNTAANARLIAREENGEKEFVEDVFMAGLLHDVGILILADNFADKYRSTIQNANERQINYWEVELQTFGTTHANVGGYLLGLWGLPDELVEAVTFHHSLNEFNNNGFSAQVAVHVADAIDYENNESVTSLIRSPRLDLDFLKNKNFDKKLSGWLKKCNSVEKIGEGND